MSDAGAPFGRFEPFESERAHLLAVAYRMLGTMSDAEDAVQECFLRVREVAPDSLESPRAFYTTVVTRICLDLLKAARVRRQAYEGPWLPEPVRTDPGAPAPDLESVGMAFLIVLETLSPEERAVYLLCEVFDYAHAEVAAMLGKSAEACRQALHRARQRVAAGRPRFAPTPEDRSRLVGGFLVACRTGDVGALRALLTDDVVAWSDGGGKVKAARQPIVGPEAVARYFVGLARMLAGRVEIEPAEMNGAPALVLRLGGNVDSVVVFELVAGDGLRIGAIRLVRNPDKLTRI